MGIVASDSAFSGLLGWNYPNNPGLEYLGVSYSNATYTGFHFAFTFVPAPAGYYQDTPANMLATLDSFFQPSSPPFINEINMIFTSLNTAVNPLVYGTPSIKNLTGITNTVCVFNCGLLPWTFVKTYAASGSNIVPVNVPYQRFSMWFTGIDTYGFQTNNHVTFNRDTFQLR